MGLLVVSPNVALSLLLNMALSGYMNSTDGANDPEGGDYAKKMVDD